MGGFHVALHPEEAMEHCDAVTILFAATLCAASLFAGCAQASSDSKMQMLLGNPSGATTSAVGTQGNNNYLISRPQYALSYNQDKRIPNWVSWNLSRKDIGRVSRSQFMPDPDLPSGWYAVRPNDYSGSGDIWNRGHMCPAADRSAKRKDNQAVFYMTNIIPQAADINQGPWERLEAYCRALARKGNDLFIIAGVSGEQGKLPKGSVSIPARNWKIVVVVPSGRGNPLQRIKSNTRVIAVDMPNRNGPRVKESPWTGYRTTVRKLEQATGYNFLANVPQAVQDAIETRQDTQRVGEK
jgi:endonuclease G